ncbi:MAG: hypothetical protein QOI27_274 [Gaiellaceae bacterium]|nr:hypothetical protein [Gaiellaceae bacterium]
MSFAEDVSAGTTGAAGAGGFGVGLFDAADASAEPPTASAAMAARVTPSLVMRVRIAIPFCRGWNGVRSPRYEGQVNCR